MMLLVVVLSVVYGVALIRGTVTTCRLCFVVLSWVIVGVILRSDIVMRLCMRQWLMIMRAVGMTCIRLTRIRLWCLIRVSNMGLLQMTLIAITHRLVRLIRFGIGRLLGLGWRLMI